MKKYDLLRSGDSIIRMLDMEQDRVLVIDCIKHSMPVWMDVESLKSYSVCTDNELYKTTGFISADIDTLDAEQRKVMYERYTMITPILPFLLDDKMRSKLICSVAEEHEISKC